MAGPDPVLAVFLLLAFVGLLAVPDDTADFRKTLLLDERAFEIPEEVVGAGDGVDLVVMGGSGPIALYALVPLLLTADAEDGGLGGPKTINPGGRFWAEVSASNRQAEVDLACS